MTTAELTDNIQRLQGQNYLLLGFLAFIILMLILRAFGTRKQQGQCSNTSKEDINQWDDLEPLLIKSIIQETSDIKTFRLQRVDAKPFPSFSDGQFLSFQIPHGDKSIFRSYSIHSSATNTSTISIGIKKLDDGIGSCWFHNRTVGDTVQAYAPAGLFSPSKTDMPDSDIVLIGAGIGITPLLSITQTAIDQCHHRKIDLFYAARTFEDLAFHAQLTYLAKTNDNFHYYPLLSRPSETWTGLTGRLSLKIIKSKIANLSKRQYFFCGPPAMTDTIQDGLIAEGVSEEQLHGEKFASPLSLDSSQFKPHSVTITANGKALAYDGRDTLLDFLEAQQVPIKFACKSGVCGACKAKRISGTVNEITNDGLSRQEQKEGYILCCVSRPESNVELQIPS